jgi:hypothetical protein
MAHWSCGITLGAGRYCPGESGNPTPRGIGMNLCDGVSARQTVATDVTSGDVWLAQANGKRKTHEIPRSKLERRMLCLIDLKAGTVMKKNKEADDDKPPETIHTWVEGSNTHWRPLSTKTLSISLASTTLIGVGFATSSPSIHISRR